MASDSNPFRVQRLKGSQNWEFWALRMEAYIIDKGYESALYPIVPYNDEESTLEEYTLYLKDREKKSIKASALIRLALDDGPLIQVKGLNDAITIWDRLKNLYEPKGFSSEFLLCKELFSTSLSRCGNSIESYLTRIKRLSDELASRDLGIPNKVIVAYALNNLTRDYEHTVAIITQELRSTDKEIDLNAIFSYLIDETRRLQSLEPEEMAMNSNTQQNQPKCGFCKKKGHSIDKCWKKNPHLQPKRANKGSNSINNPQDVEATLLTQDEDQLAQEELALSTTDIIDNQDIWILDSGATRHICAYKSLFSDLRPYNTSLNWGKVSNIPVKWIGTIHVKFGSTGRTGKIEDCLYVPEMGLNLLSLGLLRKKGVSIKIGLNTVSLTIKGTEIALGRYERNLITISTTPIKESAHLSTQDEPWHERMGHIGSIALKALPEKTLGCDLPIKSLEKIDKCDICIQAKATAKISRIPMPRASEILEKVHSDICGPISPKTLSKKRYFVSFIDDKTRWATVILLSTRDQLFNEFNSYLSTEEKQSNAKLKRLHSDNAREYKNTDFRALFTKKGVISTYTAPYTPAQNGISEIFNRTIINKVRSMLISSGVPKALWGEAVLAATYIYNRTPHSSLEGFITPFEAKYGEKPTISNIRIWGSIAYKKEPKELLKKLDSRANPYILIGYGSNQYRLIKPNTSTVIMARDVDILEGVFIKDIPQRLETKLAKIKAQIDSISDETLSIPQEISINRDIKANWLESFYQDLENHATETDEELALISTDPTYKEAMSSKEASKWKEACIKELKALKDKDTWTLIPYSKDLKVLDGKWVLKIKDPYRNPIYKARWVARGFQQQYGIDFLETFANTVNTTAWRLILAIAGHLNWEIRQWDVKSAFPNAYLHEEVYIQQPKGFEDPEHPNWICSLNKALYGLKQSGREWEIHLRGLLQEAGLYPLKTDQSIYLNKVGDLILLAYVDDLIILSSGMDKIKDLWGQLAHKIEMKDLGDINEFLGIKVSRNREMRTISLGQYHYIEKYLSKRGLKDKKSPTHGYIGSPIPIGAKIEPLQGTADSRDIKDFQQRIGSLIYLMNKTRVDLAYPIGCLARYMANPGPLHFKVLDKVEKYIENTPKLGLSFQSNSNSIDCYVDADWGGDIGTRRSTTGYIFLYRGSPISWSSKLQKTVALSSCEAEYMALKEAIKEQQYIRAILHELKPILGDTVIECSNIYTDSNSAIELAKNPVYHARTKHIDIQYHFTRECLEKGLLNLIWTPTDGQLADGLTKPISNDKWTRFIKGIGLKKSIRAKRITASYS
jgi:hypothetical protein